ncbi:MAG: anthranilate synthase component I [Algisphaera sp.]
MPDACDFASRFAAAAADPAGRRIPVVRRLLSDVLTPVSAYRALVHGDARLDPSFLFESVVDGERVGRFSTLGSRPVAQVIARGHQVTVIDDRDSTTPRRETFHSDDPLAEAPKLTAGPGFDRDPKLPIFTGGWVGYAGYDTVRYLEREKLDTPPVDDRDLPDLHFQLYLQTVVFDHVQKTVMAITHVDSNHFADADAAFAHALADLDVLEKRLLDGGSAPLPTPRGHVSLTTPPPPLADSNMPNGGYAKAVETCKRYIAAGDAFQIVPSQRFAVKTATDPFDVYRALRVVNPSPYMFYLQTDGAVLVGSSPEILVNVTDGKVTSRPLAGTRHRGADAAQDEQLAQEMQADPKDRAEHVMLVDLHRNDVGRVAQVGTVELPELLAVERYSHVMHLSSTVTGTLREGVDCWDALRVSLPVGTVSGAPKVRAMQIIDSLEPTRRGPYAGAVGYADFSGNLDMCIALRTMVVLPPGPNESEWTVHIQAGAGVVADSNPQAEHEETVNKAAALARAVALAEELFGTVPLENARG